MCRIRILAVVLFYSIAAFAFTDSACAQMGAVANTTATPIPGVPHDYIVDLNEIVNPANGALSVRIPVPTPRERGVNYPTYALLYDSNGWYTLTPSWATYQDGSQPFTGLDSLTYATPANGSPVPNSFDAQPTNLTITLPSGQNTTQTHTCTFYSGYVYTDPDGGRHGLGVSYGKDGDPNGCSYFDLGNYYYQGGDSRYKYIFNSNIVDVHGNVAGDEDVNGNLSNSTGRTWLSSGAVNGFAIYSPNPATLTPPGVHGSYSYTKEKVDVSFALNIYQTSQNAVWGGCAGGLGKTINPYASIIQAGSPPPNIVEFYPVQTLTLPDGQQYVFGYDPTLGLLNKITYPTGATVEYTWSIIPKAEGASYHSVGPAGLATCSLQYDWFAITKRVVKLDGVNPTQEQDFLYSTQWPTPADYKWLTKSTTVTTKDILRGTSFTTVYNYSPMAPPPSSPNWYTYDLGYFPVENNIVYNDTNGSLIKTTYKVWSTIDQLTAECVKLPNGLISGKFYAYEPYAPLNGQLVLDPSAMSTEAPTDVAEYDYGTVSTACVKPALTTLPIRETVTTYQTLGDTPLFAGHAPLQDRPATVKVYGVLNATKTLFRETDYAYDQTAPATVSPTPSGHDEAHYGVGSIVPRGNPTTVTQKCFVPGATQTCTDSVSVYTYDTTGQIVSVQDANKNTTMYFYTDNYTTDDGTPPANTNAYVTKIIRPTTANGVSHISKFQYGFQDGKLRSTTDENNQLTTFCYWIGGCAGSSFEYFFRLTQAKLPDGGGTTTTYSDAGPSPSVTTTKLATPSPTQSLVTNFDALGRPVKTLTSDSDCLTTGFDRTDTTYDGLGRIYKVSNPYCTTSDPTYGLTTYTYDAIGRTTQVTHPDNTTILTTYVDRATIVQDEGNGTQRVERISQVDGLGHLVAVCEVSSASLPVGQNNVPASCALDGPTTNGFLTSYVYALDNLKQVNQGTMPARSFVYDSLSHLISSSNPESGTIVYTYDANGNVSTRTDARSIKTTYQYDTLNRNTQKTYSDSTPTATFYYDTTPQNFAPTNPIGRLVQAIAGCAYSTNYYDVIGRITAQYQQTPVYCVRGSPGYYPVSYSYDLAGDMTLSSNGNFVNSNYSYNNAGRLTSVTSSYVDSQHPASLLSGATYNAFGGLATDTLGDGETESFTYDNRVRLQAVSAKYNSTPTYSFSLTFAPNSNVLASIDSVNGSWTYSYDPFNRLTGSNQNSGAAVYSYAYDRFGNRWQQNGPQTFYANFTGNNPASPNNNNRMDGYSYDAAGNLLNDGVHAYTYDAENHIMTVTGGGINAAYTYDALGHRVSRTGTTDPTCYNTGIEYLIYDLQDHIVGVDQYGGTGCTYEVYAGGRHLVSYFNGGTIFSHGDWLGTERSRTYYGAGGAGGQQCTSLPFGDGLSCNGSEESTVHFTGKIRDAESGLDNFGARYNASSMGRFMTPDWSAAPMGVPYADFGNPQSLNLYSYVKNNPVTATDPDGHVTWWGGCDQYGDNCSPEKFAASQASNQALQAHQQQSSSSGGRRFWSHVSNFLHGRPWNYGLMESVTSRLVTGEVREPNPYVAIGTDVLGIVGEATHHPSLGKVGAIISIRNDPGITNLAMTGAAFVPVLGEGVAALAAVQDVATPAAQAIIDHVMAPMFNAAPPQNIDNGNGRLIPNPQLMDECQGLGGCQ